jgi:subtilisin family serine protease
MKSTLFARWKWLVALAGFGAACSSEPGKTLETSSEPAIPSAAIVTKIQSPVLERFAQGAQKARVIVTFRAPELDLPHALHFGHADRTLALRAVRDRGARIASLLAGQTVHHRYESVNAIAVTLDTNGLDALRADPDVESVVLDQGGSGHLLEAVPLSRLDVVQAQGLTGAGVTVAVIDSGIDRTHPDLADSLAAEACFCSGSATGDGVGCCPNGQESQQGAGAAADDNGHGTNVAGIVTSNGTIAPKGGAPGASIVAVKVLDASNSFNFSSDVIAGFDWVISNHPEVKVVNASLGTFALQPGNCDGVADAAPWKTAIDTLRANGTLVFASSGNQQSSTGLAIPACVTNTIAVGAVWDSNVGSQGVFCTETTTAADKITCFTNSDSALDLLAPGAPTTSTGLGGGVSTYYGTSQASPLSAACAALLLQRNGALTPNQIETALKASPTRITDARNGLVFPRLDCGDALTRIGSCTAESDASFCSRLGKNCGSVTANDNCGNSRTVASCGSCAAPQTCGGGGSANVCGGNSNPDRTEGGTATGTGSPCNTTAETVAKAYDNLMTSTNFSKWCVTSAPSASVPISTVYDFAGTTAFAITSYTVTTANDVPNRDPKDWTFQGCQSSCSVGSDSGWVTLDTRTGQFANAARFQTNTYSFTNSTAYQQYRLRITANNGATNRLQLAEIQMFGGAASCTAESDASFCSRLGKNCGTVTANDNCGTSRTVSSCGSCTSPQTCGGGGTANVCGSSCTAESDAAFCTRLGKNCGTVTASDNCGTSRTVSSCGSCTSPQTCGGGGTANVCGGGSGPACAAAYAQGNCLAYAVGTQVSSAGHNWTCSNGNCANCASFASCAPGGSGCPWGVVWADNGACH